ncbi:MAG: hypothetical protein ACM3NO_03750, partial [Deltaproteobacteria bacterium]
DHFHDFADMFFFHGTLIQKINRQQLTVYSSQHKANKGCLDLARELSRCCPLLSTVDRQL